MAKKPSSRRKNKPAPEPEKAGIPRGWGEFLGVGLLAIGGLMLGGLASYQFGDGTLMGPVGRLVAGALYAGFGMASYLVVLGVFGVGAKALLGKSMEIRLGEGLGFTAAAVAACVLLHITFPSYRVNGYTAGGLSGELLGEVGLGLFEAAGTYLVCLAVLVLGLIASTPLSFAHLLVGGKILYRTGGVVLEYLWEGVVNLVRTQARDDDDGFEYVEEYVYEDEEEEEEEEDEDDAPIDEEDPESVIEVPEKPKKKAKPKARAKKAEDDAKKPRKNKKRAAKEEADEELDEEESEENEAEEEAEEDAAPAKAKKQGKPKVEEIPEIVCEEPAPEADPNRKKAPPRPGELAKRTVAAVPAEPEPAVKEARREGAMPVKYLKDEYGLPPLELFEAVGASPKEAASFDKEFVYAQAERIVNTLAQFRIKGKVTKIHPGPIITRYEFKPEAGVKVSKIQNLENDLAMALEAVRIRILAPIPGKSTVGLEVPNQERETVFVQEILEADEFNAGKMRLPLALGKNITGKTVAIDLAKAPHMLVAGATGSGKSVGVNSMLCSLLYTCSPEELRMILIDPKMLEFSVYRDIPHLLLPVIVDAEKANLALRWTVDEMERRYSALSEAGVRNLDGYNKKVPELQARWEAEKAALEREAESMQEIARRDGEASAEGTKLGGVSVDANGQQSIGFGGVELPPRPEKLPFIVVVIDEFADLMMVASKEVEANVARIAAKARAAGIHLIVATQRPSVDVITGTIKNNFPTRIAFQVTSDVDSRTILDQKGAKQLLGMGDMLYMDRGKEPARVHGCFVSEQEIERVVDFVKAQAKPGYNLDITKKRAGDDEADNEKKPGDPLYDKAVRIVAERQKVSTSMLQRHLEVGYNRAAKLVERMETEGVIGPPNGSKPRDVYISPL